MFYCAIGAQSAQLLGSPLYNVGRRGKQNLKISLINLLRSFEIVGVRNLTICETMNFKLHINLMYIEGGGVHTISHFKSFSIRASLDSNTNNDMKLLLKYIIHGCRILVEET